MSSNPPLNFIAYTLGVDIYGQYVADRVIEYGDITTAYGIDRITGMPVLVFTSDAPLMAQTEPPLEHPNLALTLEQGRQAERYFVVQALPMGYTQVKSLRGVALEHFYDGARAALSYLRGQEKPHGAVRVNHLWWDGNHLLLAGAGLPWSSVATVEADVGALEGLVAGLAGTELSGGRPVGPAKLGFVPQSLEISSRKTEIQGREILASSEETQNSGPLSSSAVQVSPVPPVLQADLEPAPPVLGLHSKFLSPGAPFKQATDDPEKSSDVAPPLSTIPKPPTRSSAAASFSRGLISRLPRASSLSPSSQSHPSDEEVKLTSADPTLGRVPPADLSEAQGVMRIGFEDDNSWRKVRAIVTPASPGSRNPILLIGLGVLAAAALIGAGSYFLLRPPSSSPVPKTSTNDPKPNVAAGNDTCCVVNFSLKRGGKPLTKQARLLVAESPAGSPLKAGDVLGIIPGPVRLPANPAKYSLLVQLEGYADQTLDLQMPSSQPVVIGLP